MVLPRVPLLITASSAIAGGGGLVAGAVGGVQIKRAETQKRHHRASYEDRHNAHLAEHGRTNAELQSFGRTHERVHRDVVLRMRDFLERNGKQVLVREHLILDELDFSTALQVVALAKLDLDVEGWAQGVIRSALAGRATWAALHDGVKQFGNASTGTPLSALRGIAAERARLAYLGGGSLASGGGGMALGATVQKVAVAGPVLLVAGLTTMMQGTKARTEADEYRTAVGIAIAQLDARDELFRGVRKRAQEKHDVLTRLAAKAARALDQLGPERLDMAVHGERLQTALILVKSVQEVAAAPVADEDSNLDPNTEKLIFKYRDARKETPDA
jgi:hypothetical protein